MVTVLRRDGLRIVIYLNDHEPAHVHAFVGGGEAKIHLFAADGAPRAEWAVGMNRAELRRVMVAIGDERDYLLRRWRALHGRRN